MLSAGDAPREVRAAILTMKRVTRDLRSDINRATREKMNPVWRGLVQVNATYKMDGLVLAKGARIKAGNPPVAMAATSRRRLRGGLVPAEHWHAYEFGSARHRTTYTRRSKNGGSHQVTRVTTNQLPRRVPSGRVVFPSMAEIGPRLASLWVQLIVRKVMDASEGK